VVYIRLKTIVDESFQDYKKPAMILSACKCDWKCCIEQDIDISICLNSELTKQKELDISIEDIINRYTNNPIPKAIIIAGLEPLLQFDEVLEFIKKFREICDDDLIIYTGYYPEEIKEEITILQKYKNIIMKFGRYKPNTNKKYDDILGIWLVSDNQFARRIS